MKDPAFYKTKNALDAASSINPEQEENDPFKLALEASIQEQIDTLMKEIDPTSLKMIPPEVRRAKLEKELRDSLDFSELGEQVATAINIFENEGQEYLTQEEHSTLLENLEQLRRQLDALEFSELGEETLRKAYAIPPEGLDLILKIGTEKFNQGKLNDSVAIFTFLSTLNPDDADYPYRLGIVAQKNEQYDQALQAYKTALALNPQLVGAHLFSAVCHFNCKRNEDVLKEVTEAKNILKTTDNKEEWPQLITYIEKLVA